MSGLNQSGLRLLTAYGLVSAVIFALQLFPPTGIILMMFAGPFWIGILAHVAMAHMALLAIAGHIPRAWLVLPFSFYAGGYGLHLLSVHAAKTEAATIEAHNALVRLSVEKPFRYLRDGNADSFSLIEHYRVDRSFIRQPDGAITTTYYAHGADCDNAMQSPRRRNEPWAFRENIFSYYNGPKTKQCILLQNALPAEWRYRISANYNYKADRASKLFERVTRTFEIFDERDNRVLGTIELATFTPFPVIPSIVVGCALNSAAPKWQCVSGLAKSGASIAAGYKNRALDDPQKNPFIPSLDAETWDVTQLARALGLEPRQPTD